jgi:hypothetical protein
MPSQDVPQSTPLSYEDQVRASRLHEEITGRLTELALIIGRTLGKRAGRPVQVKLRASQSSESSRGEPTPLADRSIELVCVQFSDGSCGCYDYIQGICRPCGPGDLSSQ